MLARLSIRNRLALGMLAVLVVVWAAMTPLMVSRLSHTITEAEVRELTGHYRSVLADVALRGMAANELATVIANLDEVKRHFAAGDRASLKALLSAPYAKLAEQGRVSQFQFHTPDLRSFLRLHMPEKFGDDLSSFRHTLVKANAELIPVTGLELGVADLGIRSVVPVMNAGRHLGSVEFGLDMAATFIADFKRRHGVDIAIHVPDGQDFLVRAATAPSQTHTAELARAFAGENVIGRDTVGDTRWVRLLGALPDYSGAPVAVIELMMDASPLATDLRSAWQAAFAVAVAALGIGLGVAWLIARSVIAPLEDVTLALSGLAEGRLAVVVPGLDRLDEVGHIARAVEIFKQRSIENFHLHGKENELVALVQCSSDAIVGQSPDGAITSWNTGARRIYGWSASEIIGSQFSVLFPPDDRTWGDLIDLVAFGATFEQRDMEHQRKDGTRIAVSVTFSPIRAADQTITGISAIIRDVSAHRAAEQGLRKVNRAMKALSAGNQALVHAQSEQVLLDKMCWAIVEVAGYHSAWVGLTISDTRKLKLMSACQRGREPGPTELQIDAGLPCPAADAIRSGRPLVKRDAGDSGGASMAALPLFDLVGVPIGALTIHADDIDAFDDDEMRLLKEMAGDLGFGISILRMRADRRAADRQFESVLESTIQAVAGTVEVRDPYTAGHQRRVSAIAVAIARAMSLPEDRIQGILVAGIVHDIGKIAVPSEILNRPGKLRPVEFELIKTHAEVGYDIIKGIDFPWPVAQAVLQHHERLDGTGYPQGLADDAILMEARILAVADVVDAIASHRPYRPALGLGAAIEELEAGRGLRYDPAVVDAFIQQVKLGVITIE